MKNDANKIENIIEVKNFNKKFRKNTVGEFSFNIKKGEITALLGVSGSGKSVLINSIVECYKKYKGKIFINQKSIKKMKSYQQNVNIGFYTQIDFSLQNISLKKYFANMSLIMGIRRKEARKRI
ncbi:ATP-binding cassette domain-containing protein [Spiroplasma taiwanense]|uniref:ATP-binding cassette domain-containing protein n=1 Tax=Spiroplasma taiwanense TaxID=2145 RepID=UPI000424BC9A|nr:ATP-binding cassette domain-containing protein [Spiroplasma taiwanense]